jgi:hypothetical protein
METVFLLLVSVALISMVAQFYGRLIRSGFGLAAKLVGRIQGRQAFDNVDDDYTH